MDIHENTYVSRHSEANSHDPHGDKAQAELELCALIFEKLWAHYPKRDWKVKVDIKGGMATVQLPRLHHSTLGYNFPLSMLSSDPNMDCVVEAGGALLEHMGLSRSIRFNKAEYVDAIVKRPVAFTKHDWNGQLAADKHSTRHKPRLIVPDRLKYYRPTPDAIQQTGSVEAAILAYAREIGFAA